jgi:glycosyltransferase involved in cell wall biosynthesis
MRVGILINNYNNGRWLRACLDSALAQTRPADEMIAYDDGSNDDSLAILRSYGDRIRVIEGVHRFDRSNLASQAAAIAGAFAASTADHLYLLDGDDRYLPHHITACEAAWQKAPEAVMVQVAVRDVDEAGRFCRIRWEIKNQQTDYLRAIYRLHDPWLFSPTSALAFSRQFLLQTLPLEIPQAGLTTASDARLSWAAVFSGRILWLADHGVDYLRHSASMSELNGILARTIRQNTEAMINDFNDYAQLRGHHVLNPWRNQSIQNQFLRSLLPRRLGDALAQTRLKRDLRRRNMEDKR